jgi:hypothetical protein
VSSAVDYGLIGRLLREIQAEMRTIRSETGLIRLELGRSVRREELLDVLRVLSERIAAAEAAIISRLDQTEGRVEERLSGLEGSLAEALLLLRRLKPPEPTP